MKTERTEPSLTVTLNNTELGEALRDFVRRKGATVPDIVYWKVYATTSGNGPLGAVVDMTWGLDK